jgi:hypothetical protein
MMRTLLLGLFVLALLCGVATAADRKGIRFWNLTTATIVKLQMSPAGKDTWGPDQCRNDKDGTVDHDERLRITGVEPGRHDVRVSYRDGRTCVVRNLEVKDGGVFSIEDKDLTECAT